MRNLDIIKMFSQSEKGIISEKYLAPKEKDFFLSLSFKTHSYMSLKFHNESSNEVYNARKLLK